MIIESMQGLGDNIYQRAFLRDVPETIWINTPWPEVYQDLPHIRFTPRTTTLRTQRKNLERIARRWSHSPPHQVRRHFRYSREGVFDGMARASGLQPTSMDLPTYGENPHRGERYALIRPCTVRAEWRNESRNPKPEYLTEAVRQLREAGIKTISVADIEDGHEWTVGELPPTDVQYHRGELNVCQLLSLTQEAWLVVGPIGWIVPACMAYKTPAVIICGGQGGFNHPSLITTESINSDCIHFAAPEPMCMCTEKAHACQKEIPGFDSRFKSYLDTRVGHGVVAG